MKKFLIITAITNKAVFLLCTLLIASASVHAQLLVYEPFDVDSATGPGTIWWGIDTGSTNLGPWDLVITGTTPCDASNSYLVAQAAYIDGNGVALPTSGVSARVDSNDNTTKPDANLKTPVSFSNGGTAYMSFLAKHNSDDRQWNRIGFKFDLGNVWVEFPANTQNNGTRGVFFNGATGPSLSEIIPNNVWYFFVVRVDFSSTGPETLTLWWNPPLAGEPDLEDALLTATNELGSTLSNISAISKAAVTSMEFDEIRVGTSYADVTGISSLVALNPQDKELDVRNDVGASANGPGLVLNWSAPDEREFVVIDYTVSMGDKDPNFPQQANLFSGVTVAVDPAPVKGVTTPAGQTDPNGLLDISSTGSYPREIKPDTTYYWQVFANIYEPNFNAGQPDPNIPVFNILSEIGGTYWSFGGEVTKVTITAGPTPASTYLLPDVDTHLFDATETVEFAVDFQAGIAVDTVEWFLDGSTICLWSSGEVSGDVNCDIVVNEVGINKKATLTISIPGMDTNPSAGEAYEGEYTCTITLTNASTDTTETGAGLYVSSEILAHRWSFDETSGSTVADSIGDADGTIIDPQSPNISLGGGQITFAAPNGQSDTNSGDPNAHYVDLGAGLVSKFGKAATFMVWFTRTDAANVNNQKVLSCGNALSSDAALISRLQIGSANVISAATDLPGSGNDNTTSGDAAALDTEVCVTFVVDDLNNLQKMYVNGVADPETDTTHDLSEIEDINCWLGRANNTTYPLFIGKINEVRVYNVPLNAAWVKALTALGPDGEAKNPAIVDPCVAPLDPKLDTNDDCEVDLSDLADFITRADDGWLACGLLSCR